MRRKRYNQKLRKNYSNLPIQTPVVRGNYWMRILKMADSPCIWGRYASSSKTTIGCGNAPEARSKKRDQAAFEQTRRDIEQLKQQAKDGEIELAYVDEVGFACVHPNRNAWTRMGEQHLIPAIQGKRLNVLGALMSSGYLEDYMFRGRMTGEILLEFIKDIASKYDKPITFILDNASFHRCNLIQDALPDLKKMGVTLKFLSPYSPELNRIEKLWHTIKHHWMEVKCRTIEILESEIAHIFENFGSIYKFDFYGK